MRGEQSNTMQAPLQGSQRYLAQAKETDARETADNAVPAVAETIAYACSITVFRQGRRRPLLIRCPDNINIAQSESHLMTIPHPRLPVHL